MHLHLSHTHTVHNLPTRLSPALLSPVMPQVSGTALSGTSLASQPLHRAPDTIAIKAVAPKAIAPRIAQWRSRPQAHSAHGHDITRLAPLTSLHCTQRHRVLHRCASHRCDLRHRAPHRRAPHHRSPHRCAPSRRVAHKAGCTLRCIHHLQRSTSTTHLPAPRRHTPCSLAPHNESRAAPAPKLSRLTPCLGRWGLCCTVRCQPVDSSCEL